MLELVNVGKSYRAGRHLVRVLKDLSLSVGPGEFAAVQGPSGSGKTTLLLAAGGLLRPDSGTVRLDGVDLYQLSHENLAALCAAHRLRIPAISPGTVPDGPAKRPVSRPGRGGGRSPGPSVGVVETGGTGRAGRPSARINSVPVSASALPWPGPCYTGRRSSWPTSRPAISMKRMPPQWLGTCGSSPRPAARCCW